MIKRLGALCMLFTLTAVVMPLTSGCDKKKAETKVETTTTTPDGSKTETETHKVETTGENPPK